MQELIETVFHRTAIRGAALLNSIPIDNWFEWIDEGGPKKQPYLIRRRDRVPILCAAIGQFPDEGAYEYDGFVIITADSVGGMVDIHDRRPVVLNPYRLEKP